MDLLHTILKDDIKKATEERRVLRKKLKAEKQRKNRIKKYTEEEIRSAMSYIFQLSFPNSDKSLERQSQLENDVIEELIASKLLFRKEVK